MKKRIIALLLCACMLLSDGTMALSANSVEWSEDENPTAEETAKKSATILLEGEECDSFYLGSDEKRMLMVTAEFPISSYQWQILADQSLNLWVNILDRTDMECEVSVALLESVLSGGGSTALRCVVSDYEGNQVTSNAVNVTVIDSTALVQTVAETDESVPTTEGTGDENNDEGTVDYVTVTIEYLFGTDSNKSGKVAAKEYVAKIMNTQWAEFKQTVTSPAVVGYTAGKSQVTISTDLEGLVDHKDGTYTYKVYYSPAEVNYTVHYYFQKIYSDEYDDGGWDVRQAFTETTLEYAHLEYKGGTPTGYYEMYYATEDVAADGSTVVECYFDRQYYLIRFDCNEGYGTDPIYARYGTTFAVNEPVRYGYTFTGWTLSNTTDFTGDLLVSLQKSVPAVIDAWPEAPAYQAQWVKNPSSVSYKIAYWGVSGDTKYLLGTKIIGGATAGDKVSGQDDLFESSNYICGQTEHQHTAACSDWLTYLGKQNYSVSQTTLSNNDKIAFEKMKAARQGNNPNWDFEEGYFYVVTTKNDGNACWPKLVVHYADGDAWYQLGQGTKSDYDSKFTKVDSFEYTEDGWGNTWYITQYRVSSDTFSTCGTKGHTHTDSCRNTDNYLKFKEADTNVVVKGDNSTVVNVYYEHKQYTLRFYYARSSEDTSNNTIYQVVGGSTYHFGASATNADMNSATGSVSKLLGNVSSWGKVANEPKLKDSYINDSTLIKKYELKNDTISMGGYTYYYLEFTAGFGTDISDVWPVDILESVKVAEVHTNANHGGATDEYEFCKYEYAYFSAWNGQYGVYYSHHNTNQTIKGAYQYLDENLIFDLNQVPNYKNETTVSYLCFWENGKGTESEKWSIPKVFDYKLWKEYLKSDQDNKKTPSDAILKDGEMTTVVRNGTTYYLFKDFYVYDDSSVDEQTTIVLDGYGEKEDVDKESGDLGKVTVSTGDQLDGHYVYYYYKAQTSVKINFYNYNSDLASVDGVPYGTPLSVGLANTTVDGWSFFDKNGNVNTPPYPSALETGAYEFMGWYTTADCLENSKYDLTTETMPSTDLMLYAKWQKKTHTVQFYGSLDDLRSDIPMKDEEYQFNVTHGNVVGKDVEISGESGVAFIGWFYLDDNGNKCFFSALSTPVKSDMKIYAEWRTTDTVGYTIHYRFVDEYGDDIAEAAPSTTGTAFVNSTKTFKAVAVEGAFPLVNSHSMVIKSNPEDNVYIFEYRQIETNRYTVRYVNKVTGELLEPETVVETNHAVVTEKYKHFDNMIPDATQKTLILTTDPTKNIITFYYTYSETQTMLTLHFMKQSLPDSSENMTYVEDEGAMLDLVVTWSADNQTSTQTLRSIVGFTATHFSYKKDAVDTDKKEVKNDNTITVNLKKDGTDVYLYYQRNKVNYTVNHVEYNNTKNSLADTEKKTAYFGQTVTVSATEVKGYSVVGNASYDLVIAADEKSNVITFYYQKNNCTIYYSPVVNGQVVEKAGWLSSNHETVSTRNEIKGCTARSDSYYTFAGWFTDVECTKQLGSDYVKEDNGAFTVTPTYVEVTDPSCMVYAKFVPFKGNLTLNFNFGGSVPKDQRLLLKLENAQTLESFYFVVTAAKTNVTITINLLDANNYKITMAEGWEKEFSLDLEGSQTITVKSKDDEKRIVTIKKNDDSVWLTGYSNTAETATQTEGTT